MNTLNILIIGGNGAGLSAASQARRINPDAGITVFEASPFISFGACGFPYYISGEISDFKTLFVYTPEKIKSNRNINVLTRHRVLGIEPNAGRILVRNEEAESQSHFSYDRLIIATGSNYITGPFKRNVPQGVLGIRNATDALILKTYLEMRKPGTVIVAGGNLLGLEMAEAFRKHGMNVAIIEMKERILPDFGPTSSRIMQKKLEENGIKVITGTPVVSVSGDQNGYVKSVTLGDGKELPADMLLLAIGVKPESELGLDAGCQEGANKTILANRRMQTSVSHLYACGDCAQYTNRVNSRGIFFPFGSAANRSGRAAGENAAGGNADFPGVVATYATPVFGLEAARCGLTEEEAKNYTDKPGISESVSSTLAGYVQDNSQINIRLLYDRRNRKLLGAEIIGGKGSGLRIDIFTTALSRSMTIDDIYNLDLVYTPKIAPVWDPVLFSTGLAKHREDFNRERQY